MGWTFTEEDFKARLLANLGQDYDLAGKFSGMKKPVSILHKKCGRIYTKSTASAASINGCYHCSPSRAKTDQEMFDIAEAANKGKYTYPGLHRRRTASGRIVLKIDTKCNACGKEMEKYYTHIARGNDCAKCKGKEPLNTQTFNERISEIKPDGSEYVLASEYVNNGEKVMMLHRTCGKEFSVRPNHFIDAGSRCPTCRSSSSGEKMLSHLLDSMSLTWSRQYSFEDCRNKSRLRFDFAVFDEKSREVALLIEFDGDQHRRPVDFFGGEKAFAYLKKNDGIKNEYCSSKGINLLRFTKEDMETMDDKIVEAIKEHKRRKQGWTT
jgi:very-short-patch-repair endonuclease/predicted Zn-ribbon and HTH transcriptional regulator